MLDPNDLFAQIGFVVDSSPKRSSSKQLRRKNESNTNLYHQQDVQYRSSQQEYQPADYVTSLEIQLGEDHNLILQIRSYDDPYELAYQFCQNNNLNMLAVQVVQKKIIQAKKREQIKLRIIKQKQQATQRRQSNKKKILPHNNCNQDFLKNTPNKNKSSDHSRSISIIKQIDDQSLLKNDKYLNKQKSSKKINSKQSNQIVKNACQSLYLRGVLKNQKLQQKRLKRQQQLEEKQAQQLTFKPKINQVSQKIIEFRKQTGTVPPKNLSKAKQQYSDHFYRQLQECTFTPQINPISKMIVHNRQSYMNESEHFNELFNMEVASRNNSQGKKQSMSSNNQAQSLCKKKSTNYLIKQKNLEDQELFKPKLNPKSIQQVKEPFQARLQKAIQIKQKIKQGEYKNNQFTFQPQVGRSPYFLPSRGQNSKNNKQNIPVWQQLYKQGKMKAKQKQKLFQQNKSQKQLTNATSQSGFQSLTHALSQQSLNLSVKASNNLHYENLIQKKINSTFELLDSDGDGLICPNRIGIEDLSKNVLIFLKPIFEEMDELDAQLNFEQFKKAVINLLNDSDPYKKGLFLSDNSRKIQNQLSFTPQINPKSKQLAEGRNISQIHVGLYEQGVKNLKRKEFMIERQRARKEEKQLQQCSFKPCLHLGRKQYHPSILDRKLSDIEFSVNQSSNSHLLDSSLIKQSFKQDYQY